MSFAMRFGREPTVEARAPGRVNLMGDHTDYNGGLVLPVAIPQQTRVALARRTDERVVASSASIPGEPSMYALGAESLTGTWVDYVAGVTWAFRAAGLEIGGFDAFVSSEVPIGSGLSSSAALEVAVARGLRSAFSLRLSDVEIAKLAHDAETGFVGVPVGVMDQMAASIAEPSTALYFDTQSGHCERLELPPTMDLLVIDSGIRHALVDGSYRRRRDECEQAALRLGVHLLREAETEQKAIARLPPPLDRRARHVVTENERVREAVLCLRSGDAKALGLVFDASHASLRDDFEVSIEAIDTLVATTRAMDGCYGARLTGGGFGGSIVAVVEPGRARAIGRAVTARPVAEENARARVVVPL